MISLTLTITLKKVQNNINSNIVEENNECWRTGYGVVDTVVSLSQSLSPAFYF